MDYLKHENKEYRYDWENIKVGDYVFTDTDVSFCSGGVLYGVGDLVVEITEKTIKTDTGEIWDRDSRYRVNDSAYVYYLGAYQSN